jgi:hypothetical protein
VTPVYQTKSGPEVGNCYQASVASLLGLPLNDVPDFGQEDDPERSYTTFVGKRGFIVLKPPTTLKPNCYYLAFGPSVVTGRPHVVVYRAGKLSHDPHKGRNGLSSVEVIHILVPMEIDLG